MELFQKFLQHARFVALGGLCAANLFIWHAVFAESRVDILTVAFLDVDQGDAIFIDFDGAQILIDGGPGKAVLRELGKVMPYYDRSIDVVVATHPDADHISGLSSVLERYDVSYFLESGARNDTGAYRALAAALTESPAVRLDGRRGMTIRLGGNARLDILFPDRDVSRVSDTNDASIIARLVYGETEALLTGDTPQKIERYLVALDGHDLKSDILKVGHHGSKTSTSDTLLGFVDPDYAVISAGRDNRYGHPHQEVLDALDRFDIEILHTAETGTVIFTSDSIKWYKKK